MSKDRCLYKGLPMSNAEAEASNKNKLNITDLQKLREELLKDPEFRPKWKYRRRVIFGTLILCGVLITLIIVVPLFASLEPTYELKDSVADVLSAALYVLAFTAVAVIGSYVFGSAFESKDYRAGLTKLAQGRAAG